MKLPKTTLPGLLAMLLPMTFAPGAHAGATIDAQAALSTRYGLFGMLDHRSGYGEAAYPEPFLIDDSNLELNEFRVDWVHTGIHGQRDDEVTVEFEKGFGLLTLEVELHYESSRVPGESTEAGVGNIDLGARYPIFQYVSKDGFFDTTFGVAAEVGIPTETRVSKSTEVVPKIFNDLRVGKHFTVQSIVGYSFLSGGDDDGIQTLEYGFTFGYAFTHEELTIPGVQQVTPVFEISGEKQLNKEDSGRNSVTGDAGLRVNLRSFGTIQPRLGIVYVFPMNNAAREDLHWGICTSLVFEYLGRMNDDRAAGDGLNRKQFLFLACAACVAAGCEAVDAGGSTGGAPRVVDAGPGGNYAADGLYTAFLSQGFFLVRRQGKLVALSSYCTHRHCKLTAEADKSFYCDCHGSTFDPGGKVTEGPAKRDLPQLPFSIDARGHVLVSVV